MTNLDREIQTMLRERAQDIQVLPAFLASFDGGDVANSRGTRGWEPRRRTGWLVAAVVVAVLALAGTVIAIRASRHPVAPGTHTPAPTPSSSPFTMTYHVAGVELSDISCATAADCVAVGLDDHQNGVAYSFDGHSWKRAFSLKHGSGGLVVSCAASGGCVAVAGDVAEWRLTANSPWQQVNFPALSRGLVLQIADVKCLTIQSCLAVGTYASGSGNAPLSSPVAYRWDGHAWARTPTPPVAASSQLALVTVSCWAINACRATATNLKTAELLEWDGTSWSVDATPSFSSTFLTDIQCQTQENCIVLGAVLGRGLGVGSEVLAGGKWTWHPFTDPAIDAQGSVSCVNANDCVYVTTNPRGTADVQVWNGSGWSRGTAVEPLFPNPTTTANPGPPARYYGPISCVATGQCFFVGWEQGSNGDTSFVESSR